MNSNFKIPVGKYTQKRRPVSPVQTFEALRPENMGIGYRQSIDKKKEEDDSKLERRKEINSLKARIDAMSPSEQDQIRKHLLELMQANNTIAEINKSREAKQFRPIQRTKSVLKDLDTHDENDDNEIPSDQTGTWKTSYSKGGRGTNLHSLGRRRMRTRTRATKMRRAKKKTTKTKRKKRRNRSIKKRR
tara:strand:- start:726 stop:1292 length:567 start_codon:yes stop_codon:yes gene_type:complete